MFRLVLVYTHSRCESQRRDDEGGGPEVRWISLMVPMFLLIRTDYLRVGNLWVMQSDRVLKNIQELYFGLTCISKLLRTYARNVSWITFVSGCYLRAGPVGLAISSRSGMG